VCVVCVCVCVIFVCMSVCMNVCVRSKGSALLNVLYKYGL
jgi:hypothetical protein